MKRSISFILMTGLLMTAAGTAAAQNAVTDGNPVKASLKKEQEVSTAPPAPKLQTANEQQAAKSIVPGGELKQPKDTRMPDNDKVTASPSTLKPAAPVAAQQPAAVPAKEQKKKIPAKEQLQQ